MKKIASIAPLIALFFAFPLYAKNLASTHVRHIIVNNLDRNIDYEFIAPEQPYSGQLKPKEARIFNMSDSSNALGTYVLRYTKCVFICKSYNKSFVVTKNGEITWRVTKKGILVTQPE